MVALPGTASSDSGFSAETDHSPFGRFSVHRSWAWRTKISPTGPPKSSVSMYACSSKKFVHVWPASSLPSAP